MVLRLFFALFVGLPFVRIGGESALRFDFSSVRLHFFGATIPVDEFILALLALLFLAFLFLWSTFLFGRIWCGWMCPQTVLVELTSGKRKKSQGTGADAASPVKVLAVSILVGAVTLWYFIPPNEFVSALLAKESRTAAAVSWSVISFLVWLDLALVRYTFCATVCPYSRLQGVLLDSKTLVIAYDGERAEECVDCTACVKACPVGIDIRGGLQAACVNCAACVDACRRVLGRKGERSLVGYVFGKPGGKPGLLRPASLLTALAALFFLALLIAGALEGQDFQASVAPNSRYQPRRSPSGRVVNSYVLSLDNRRGDEGELKVSVSGQGGGFEVSPKEVTVKAGEHRRVDLFVAGEPGQIAIILSRDGVTETRVPAKLLAPE